MPLKKIINNADRILQSLEDGFLRADKDGYIIMANNAIASLCGFSSSREMIGLHMKDLYANPKDRDYMISEIKSKGKLLNYELELLRKDGSRFWSLSNIKTFCDDNGNILGTEGVIRDITERKLMEQKLMAAYQQLQATEEELRASNQQLSANEQQLQAANQQLSAANQQLAANEQQLRAANIQLLANENELVTMNHNLNERLKEMSCLYNISQIIENNNRIDEILTYAINEIPPGWHYPEITVCRIIFDNKTFSTKNFIETKWKQKAEIIIDSEKQGSIEVFYLEEMPVLDEGPFLKEERNLINSLSAILSQAIQNIMFQERLKKANLELRTSNQQLNAMNQQLTASEQQLQALNQQLQANEIELDKKSLALEKELLSVEKQRKANMILLQDFTKTNKELKKEISQRKRIESELKRNLETLSLGEKIADLGYFERNWETGEGYWSEGFYQLLGENPDSVDCIHEEFIKYVHPQDVKRVANHIKETLKNKTNMDIEFQLIKKGGETVYIHGLGKNFFDEKGKPYKSIGTFRNITKSKLAEKDLLKNQYYLSKAQEMGKIGSWEIDIQNNHLVWTDQNFRNFGVPEGTELTYEVFLNTVYPEDRGYVNKKWNEAIHGKPYDIEHRIVVDGKIRWLREKADVTFDANGEAVRAIGFTQDVTDRKLIEKKLEDTLSATTDGIWSWDFLTDELIFSDKYYTMLGYKPGEFEPTFKSWTDLIHPDDRREALERAEKYIETKEDNYENEFRMRTKNGNYKWIRTKAKVVERDINGNAVLMIGNHEDITKRKVAEENLLQLQELFKRTEKIGKIGGWEIDVKTRKQTWTEETFRIMEIDTEHGEPKVPQGIEFIDPPYRDSAKKAIQAAFQNGKGYDQEWLITTAKGNKRWVHSVATVNKINGEIVSITGSFQDITNRKKAEEELLASKNFIEQLYNSLADAIFTVKLPGREITHVNDVIEKIFGYTQEECIGKDTKFLYKNEYDFEQFGKKLKVAITEKKNLIKCEQELLRKDGTVFIAEITTTFLTKNNQVDSVISVVRDITERKKSEEKLKKSEFSLKEAQKIAKIGNWEYDVASDKPIWSEEMFNIFDAPPEKGEPGWLKTRQFVHPEDWNDLNKLIQQAVKEGKNYKKQFRIVRKDNDITWAQTIGYASKNDAGKIVKLFGTVQDITERKEIEMKLIESQNRLHLSLETNKATVFHDNLKTGEMFCTPEMFIHFGFKPEEIPPTIDEFTKIVHPDDLPMLMDILNKHIKGETEEYYAEYRILDKKGNWQWINGRGRIVNRNEKNKPMMLVGISQDITERKLAQEELQKSQQISKAILDAIPDIMMIIDKDNIFRNYYAHSINEFYVPPETFIGKHISEVLPPNLADLTRKNVSKVLRTGDSSIFEYSLVIQDKEHFYEARMVPMGKEQALSIIRDITLRKKAETALQASEKKLKSIIDNSTNLFYSHTINHEITFVSPQIYDLLGYKPEEVLHRWTDFITDNPMNKQGIKYTEEAIHTGERQPTYEVEMQRKDGRKIIVEVREAPVLENGKVTSIVGSLTDITKRKKAEINLQENEEKFRNMTEQLDEVLFLTDETGEIVYISPAASTVFGYTPDEMEGNTFHAFLKESSVSKAIKHFNDAVVSGNPSLNVELTMKHKTKGYFIGELSGKLYQTSHFKGTIGVIRDISERKKAEEEIKKQKTYLEKLFESSPEAIVILDNEDNVVKINSEFTTIFGYDSEEALGRKINDLIVPEDLKDEGQRATIDVANGKFISLSTIRKRKNGDRIYVSILGQPIIIDGKQQAVYGIYRDITKQKQAELKLIESEKKYKLLTEQGKDCIFSVDLLKGQYEYLSPATEKLFGLKPETIMKDASLTFKLAPEDSISFVEDIRKRTIKGIIEPSIEFPIIHHKTKKLRWIHQNNFIIRDENGKPIKLRGTAYDITERKEAEQKLIESEKRFRDISENAAELIWETNPEGLYTFVSSNVKEILGYSSNEIIGKKYFYDFVSPEIREIAKKTILENDIKLKRPFEKTISPVVHKNGSTVWLLSSGVPVLDDHGNLTGFRGGGLDITELRKADEQIKKSLDEKTVLLQEIYHRTKNNMQLISSMLNIRARKLKNDFVKEIFQDINSKIKAMALVHEKLYKSENLSMINLRTYLADLTGQIGKSFNQPNIQLSVNSEDVYVKIDSAIPLALILTELITNSYKYAFPDNRDGKISIKAYQKKETIHIILQDNGVGLPPEQDLRKIKSMGLQTVFSLGEGQLHGKIDYKTTSGLYWHFSFEDNLYDIRV